MHTDIYLYKTFNTFKYISGWNIILGMNDRNLFRRIFAPLPIIIVQGGREVGVPPFYFRQYSGYGWVMIWARTWWLQSSEHWYRELHCHSTVEFCAMFWQMFCADNPGSHEWRLLLQLSVTLLLWDTTFCWLSLVSPQRALSGVVRSGLLGGQAKGAGEASEPLPIHQLGMVSFR
jgi:hypothetical protein